MATKRKEIKDSDAGLGQDSKAQETIRARKLFLWFLVGLTLLIAVMEDAAATEAYYNPAGSPLPTKEMEAAIEYAAESAWSQRIDVGAEYVGLTGEDEPVEGSIIVRWDYFPLPKTAALSLDAGLVEHSADLSGNSVTLANARWWTLDSTGELVKGVITINIAEATKTVDKCMYELLVHEFGHTYSPKSDHSEHEGDVMFWRRGDECRYTPSLTDLETVNPALPITSCHVELTPHGDLEVLDYNGQRLFLAPMMAGAGSLQKPSLKWWIWTDIPKDNPAPRPCADVEAEGHEIRASVKGYGIEPGVMRLWNEAGRFTRMPAGQP